MKLSLICFTILLVILMMFLVMPSVLALPENQNFDEATVGDKGTQVYELNGIIYTTNDVDSQNIYIVNDGNIASEDDFALGYRNSSSGNTTMVSFATSDGVEFKLNSFTISIGLGDTNISIKGYRDNVEITSSSVNVSVSTTFDVTDSSEWRNIDEVRMIGNNLDIDIDDINLSEAVLPEYTVTYVIIWPDYAIERSGSVPIDETEYLTGETVIVMGNTGNLMASVLFFLEWYTEEDGITTAYDGGDTFIIGDSDVILYARMMPGKLDIIPNPDYNGNGNTGGLPPIEEEIYNISDLVTVLGNTGDLVKTGYTFSGWNTSEDGSGTNYFEGDTFILEDDYLVLYAHWTLAEYTVTYDGTSYEWSDDDFPVDNNTYNMFDTVTVLDGYLRKAGEYFDTWNTQYDGNGISYMPGSTFIMGSANVILYAQWKNVIYLRRSPIIYEGNLNTGGSVPIETKLYFLTDPIEILGNTGPFIKTGYSFTSWNTEADGSGISYFAGDTIDFYMADITLYAQWAEDTYNIIYDGNKNTGGTVPVDTTTYHTTDSVVILGNSGNLVRTGYVFSGWNLAKYGQSTGYIDGDYITIGYKNIRLYAQWKKVIVPVKKPNLLIDLTITGDEIKNYDDGTGPGYRDLRVGLLIDGEKKEKAVTVNIKMSNMKIDVTAVINRETVIESLKSIKSVIKIPVEGNLDSFTCQFDGELIKNLEDKEVNIEVEIDYATYTLPFLEIEIDDLLKQFDQDIKLKDILVKITVRKSPHEVVSIFNKIALDSGYEILAIPIEYTVTANYGEKVLEINRFDTYVKRTIVIPNYIDANNITTGVVLDESGMIRHIPTKIISINNKIYAQMSSLSNSNYALIFNNMNFKDTDEHWAEDVIENMGARMIVKGNNLGNYNPDDPISRAEFISVIVNAFALKGKVITFPFKDVSETDVYADDISIAYEYGIIQGFNENMLRPSDLLTREQAFSMIFRLMKLVGIELNLSDDDVEELTAEFIDSDKIADWARESVAGCIKKGVINGRENGLLSPKDKLTRAEIATIIKRLLEKADLI